MPQNPDKSLATISAKGEHPENSALTNSEIMKGLRDRHVGRALVLEMDKDGGRRGITMTGLPKTPESITRTEIGHILPTGTDKTEFVVLFRSGTILKIKGDAKGPDHQNFHMIFAGNFDCIVTPAPSDPIGLEEQSIELRFSAGAIPGVAEVIRDDDPDRATLVREAVSSALLNANRIQKLQRTARNETRTSLIKDYQKYISGGTEA